MILLLSGEGPTDIGACATAGGECEGQAFSAGPMALLINQIVEPIWEYSPLGTGAFTYVSEGVLAAGSKQLRGVALPGLKRPRETAYFYKNARALARMAKARTTPESPVGAVLFRDSDGTLSACNSLWQDKWNSMATGFKAEAFALGVPMVPKPKSEAWLLCAVQQNQYTNCARFENISGNDASPNSAKQHLDDALAARGRNHHDVCDMIRDGTVQAARIAMPSYDRFRGRMEEVARTMAGRPAA